MAMCAKGVAKLIEECGELQQVCGKRLAYWSTDAHPDGSDLRERMQDEMGDVYAAIEFVTRHLGLDHEVIAQRMRSKRDLFDTWQHQADNNYQAIDGAPLPGRRMIPNHDTAIVSIHVDDDLDPDGGYDVNFVVSEAVFATEDGREYVLAERLGTSSIADVFQRPATDHEQQEVVVRLSPPNPRRNIMTITDPNTTNPYWGPAGGEPAPPVPDEAPIPVRMNPHPGLAPFRDNYIDALVEFGVLGENATPIREARHDLHKAIYHYRATAGSVSPERAEHDQFKVVQAPGLDFIGAIDHWWHHHASDGSNTDFGDPSVLADVQRVLQAAKAVFTHADVPDSGDDLTESRSPLTAFLQDRLDEHTHQRTVEP